MDNMVSDQDALEWLRGFKTESVDLILTDPPYESLEKHRKVGTTTRLKVSKGSSNSWFDIFPNSRFEEFFQEAYRVLKKDSHLYLFSDQETMFVAKPLGEGARFKFWKPLVWKKGSSIGMGYHYRAQYELVLFFEKGKKRLNSLSIPDVLDFPPVRRGYPTEKPVDLMKVLVAQSTQPGDLVLDPFMGSGASGVAALSLGRRWAGTDTSPTAVSTTRERLSGLVETQPTLEQR